MKRIALSDISDDLETLTMEDGSLWKVPFEFMPSICTWAPTTIIEISIVDENSEWPYQLLNTEEGVAVRARKIR